MPIHQEQHTNPAAKQEASRGRKNRKLQTKPMACDVVCCPTPIYSRTRDGIRERVFQPYIDASIHPSIHLCIRSSIHPLVHPPSE